MEYKHYENKIELKIGDTQKDNLIYHPTKFINPQWVYLPSDEKYQSLQKFIQESIN